MMSFLATAAITIGLLATAPQAPQWGSDYGDALEATRSGNQPLLIVIDKSENEDARIDPAFLSEDSINGKETNLLASYELCHVDASTKYGSAVAKVFHASTYPYMAIIDKTGSVILYSKAGNVDAQEWERVLSTYTAGERVSAQSTTHVYKPVVAEKPVSSLSDGSYCPSCQRRAM